MQDRYIGPDGTIYVKQADGRYQVIPAQQQPQGGFTVGRPDPTIARKEARAEEDQDISRGRYGLSQRDEERAGRREKIDNPQALRKEYAALPEVKEFKVAAQMTSNALNTSPNPQGDIALVYAFAKAMDPGSVVRDQETNMVTASQPWFQSAVQNIKKQFGMDGAGNFTPEARASIRREIVRNLASRKPLYDARRAEMVDLAMANKIPPMQVIGNSDIEAFTQSFRGYAEKNGDDDDVIAGLLGTAPIARRDASPPSELNTPAPMGSTTEKVPIDPKMQAEHSAYLRTHWNNLDPQDYAAFRINLDKKYGFGSDPAAYAAAVPALNDYAAKGGAPDKLAVPGVEKELSWFDQLRNNAISNPVGAGAAGAMNSIGVGIPSALAPAQMQAIRDEYPVETFVGDVAGGVAGTALTGGALRQIGARMGEGAVARALANPVTADVAYGAGYGATQADDPLYGAVGGATAGFVGNRVGRAVGRAFPAITGTGRAIRQADATVPTSQALKQEAADLYQQAEARGLTAGPDETYALADRISGILSQEGRLSPKGNLTEVQTKVKEAHKLIQDYAGEEMTPTQIQTVRSVISDAASSQDASERRIAKLLLDDFDQWTDATNPALAEGLRDARGVASRYLQGDEIAKARELADVRAGQFSNSGQGNALRTDFRQLDRAIAKGQESFSPSVEAAVADVARGTTVGNVLRNVGRFAPTGPMSATPYAALAAGGGATGSPMVALGGLGIAGLTYGARQLGERVTNRSAQIAENLAYGGPAYEALLNQALEQAAIRGGHGGAATTAEVARLLADQVGY